MISDSHMDEGDVDVIGQNGPIDTSRAYFELLRHYGELITVQDIKRTDFGLNVVLKSDYPRMVFDRRTQSPYYLFLSLHNLGVMGLKSDYSFIEERSISRDQLINNIESKEALWRSGTEELVTSVISQRLVQIEAATDTFNIIKKIITMIVNRKRMAFSEIEGYSRSEKVKDYLYFLDKIGYLTRTSDGYTYSDTMVGLQDKFNNDIPMIEKTVIADILENHYSFLKEFFRISRLEPFIKLSTCIFSPSVDSNRRIFINRNEIQDYYDEFYPRSYDELDVEHNLSKLEQVKIVERDRHMVAPNEQLCIKALRKRPVILEKMSQFL